MIKVRRRVRLQLTEDDAYVRNHRYMSEKMKVHTVNWFEGSDKVELVGKVWPPTEEGWYQQERKLVAPVRGLPKAVREALKGAFK